MSFHTMRLIVEIGFSLHFFIRCRTAFGGGWWQLALLFWLIVMIVPLEGFLPEYLAGFSKLQPIWIGSLVLFTAAALGLDVLRLLTGLSGALSGHSWWPLLAAKRAVPLALLATLAIVAHSCYMARNPGLKHIVIESDKLPEDVDSLRIVQLSDLHLGPQIGLDDLKKTAALVREAKPDILVATGDVVDANLSEREAEAALLASLKPRYGFYAVLGNHEFYRGLDNSLEFMEKAGMTLLRGRGIETGGIAVVGIDDEAVRSSLSADPVRLLRHWRDSGLFVLFMKHRPRPAPGTAGLYDLQLSGHTHGGQMWPGHLLISRANGHYLSGLYENPETKSAVYVSRGSGFWGIPLRFLAPPEVTLIELVRKEE